MPTADPNLVEFNVKNVKITVDGTTFISLAGVNKIAIPYGLSKKMLFSDGKPVYQHISDRNRTIELEAQGRQDDLEAALGYQTAALSGKADLAITHETLIKGIYFEVNGETLGKVGFAKKVWVFNVELDPADISFQQNGSDINPQAFTYKGVIYGANYKATGGTADYIDPTTGDVVKCYRLSSKTGDTGFDTFGASLPVPTQPAA